VDVENVEIELKLEKYGEYRIIRASHPCIYEPSDDTMLLAGYLIKLKETGYNPSSILEIGGGSGYLSSLSRQLWPHAIIHTTEVNPYAVKGLQKIGLTVYHCEYDACIPGEFRYDLGISNPPYIPLEQDEVETCGGWLSRAWAATWDEHLLFCKALTRRANRILLITSSLIGEPARILTCLRKQGFNAYIVLRKSFFFETLYLVEGVAETFHREEIVCAVRWEGQK